MRIGIDATFVGTSRPTGLGVYTVNIVNELAKVHDDIVIWTSSEYGFKVDPLRVKMVLHHGKVLGDYLYLLRPLWMELCFPGYIRREKVDVLFSTVPGGMLFCPVPHVVTVHDLTPLSFPGDSPRSVQLNFKYRLRKILNQTSEIIANSVWTRDDICRFYSIPQDKIHVIPLGYDSDRFVPRYDTDVLKGYGLLGIPYILAVGSVSPRKNLNRLVSSFCMMKNKSHSLVLVGFCEIKAREQILTVANSLGVKGRIRFLDYVNDEDLSVLYSGATLFCYPSLYEGFGLPVLESMACGTPVVASNTTSIPEVAGDAALLVNPLSCDEISAALDQIVNDEKLRSSLITSGLKRVAGFSWEKMAKDTLSVLQRAI